MSDHETSIKVLLADYEKSLNTSDAKLAASCYTKDGVFMPTTLPTASGADMEGAYGNVFGAITLNVVFSVDELVVASDTCAYALTRSVGTQAINATGDKSEEANREIFIFQNTGGGGWKIARYMFNKAA
jgi:ketosteroid isomerase-like protein